MNGKIAENVRRVKDRIEKAAKRAGRDPRGIELLVVTKSVEPEKIIEAARAGVEVFGENYAQELRDKRKIVGEALEKNLRWHFIGLLQRNKVKYLVGEVELIHSVDNLKVVEEIDKKGEKIGIETPILLEVNLGNEETKGGVLGEEVGNFLTELKRFSNVRVKGLMTMPPYFEDPEMARPYFKTLRELRDKLQRSFPTLRELSMGMSGDFEVAVEEGATIVRVGTAIFGAREE